MTDHTPRSRDAILHAATLALRARTRRRARRRAGAATLAVLAIGALAAWRLTPPPAPHSAPPPTPIAAHATPEAAPAEPAPAALTAKPEPPAIGVVVSRPAPQPPIDELSDDELLDALATAGYRTGLVRAGDDVWLVGDPIPAAEPRRDHADRPPRGQR